MSEAVATELEGDRLLDVVVGILETEGYDAVQLREVARRAKTSLATIYKRYPTRDDLILGALEYWTQQNRYADLPTAAPGASLYESLMQLFRAIFEPWERHPAMLAAYYRVRSSPNGQKLFRFGLDVVAPAGREIFDGVDADFVEDFTDVISSVIYGLLGRYATGEIAVTDILPILDRTVYWLTRGCESSENTRTAT
ncbi:MULTISPECIES: TetR family transcriptional regulator [unclassified Mycobacterium]|uniref:TetR family transcriptional regulator n=1 Tax=unclassified Mycobacterium TaxID=2642494 RepID=UPI00040D546A|nr:MULTISPECIES: TetR family transcriptional regulator [unclassified Mycobacterium]